MIFLISTSLVEVNIKAASIFPAWFIVHLLFASSFIILMRKYANTPTKKAEVLSDDAIVPLFEDGRLQL